MRHALPLIFIGSSIALASGYVAKAGEQPIVAKMGAPAPKDSVATSNATDALADYGNALKSGGAPSTAPETSAASAQPGSVNSFLSALGATPKAGALPTKASTPPSPQPSSITVPPGESPQVAPERANGTALLPSRPESPGIDFGSTTAAELVLRFAREYHASVVLLGDGSTKMTGSIHRSDSTLDMIQQAFPQPDWAVDVQGTTYLVTQRSSLSFRRISMTDINPNLDAEN